MKSRYILSLILVITCIPLMAQVLEVSTGKGYKNQAYVSLEDGSIQHIDNSAWDLAFSAFGDRDASIFINESATFMRSPIQVYYAIGKVWSDDLSDTSFLADSLIIQNSEKTWEEGALNSIRDQSNPLDYGWGIYNTSSHQIEGARVYVLKKRDETYVKFQIKSLAQGSYTIEVADLNGENKWEKVIKKESTTSGLVYFSLDTKESVAIDAYDFVIQRYTTPITTNTGAVVNYMVTGTLLAPGSEAVVAKDVDPKDVQEADYSNQYSSQPDVIGYRWKSFSNQGWSIDNYRTQFLKTPKGAIYQLTFIDFEGSSTGTTSIATKLVKTSSSEELTLHEFTVYPNPTTDRITVKASHTGQVDLDIYDIHGAHIRSISDETNTPILLEGLSTGSYIVRIHMGAKMYTERIVIHN